VVDRGDSLRHALESIDAAPFAIYFESGAEFLSYFHQDLVGCLIINVSLPDMSGIELQRRLLERCCILPMIFAGSGSSVMQAVQVMRKGAIDFLDMPLRPADVSSIIREALERVEVIRHEHFELTEYADRYERLTPRECEVFHAVANGRSNREIAATLNVSQKTVETHRFRLMGKMGVRSLAELVRAALQLDSLRSGQFMMRLPRGGERSDAHSSPAAR
jgi:FixJ family two-component response regulator